MKLDAEEIRKRYAWLECKQCHRNCSSTVTDTLELVDGLPVFRVEVYCEACQVADSITVDENGHANLQLEVCDGT
jgi:hypothetical protein